MATPKNRLGWAILLQQIGKPLWLDIGKRFTVVFHVLEGFDNGLGHALVGAFGAANDGELLRLSDSFMPVVVV